MKVESTAFTRANLAAFSDAFVDHERLVTAQRIEASSRRLAELVARMGDSQPSGGDDWSGAEILAHIAVFSKFYGMLTYKVGSGQISEYDLLDSIQQRDVVAAQFVERPTEVLLRAIQSDHARTVEYLRSADATAMRRRVAIGDGASLSVDFIARMLLCAHLEQHVDQLERATDF